MKTESILKARMFQIKFRV